jgi:hypothetical protein
MITVSNVSVNALPIVLSENEQVSTMIEGRRRVSTPNALVLAYEAQNKVLKYPQSNGFELRGRE